MRTRRAQFGRLALAAWCAAAPCVFAAAPLPPAKLLRSAWTLGSQPCNGGLANAYTRHPDEKTIRARHAGPQVHGWFRARARQAAHLLRRGTDMRNTALRNLLVLTACLAASGALAESFSEPEVTVELPDGWVEVPYGVMQAFYDEMRRQAPKAQIPKYNYAFQSTAGPPWLAYPYVLVKVTPSGRPSEFELENLPRIDLDSKIRTRGEDWSNLMKDTSLGQMRYDKAANVVWLTSKSDVVNIGEVRGISGIIPTEQGFVELHAYARAEDFDGHFPMFEKIISAAKVAPHLAYQPSWTDKLGPFARFDFKQLGFVVVLGALIGVAVATVRKRRARGG
jgi:hypothetical protein